MNFMKSSGTIFKGLFGSKQENDRIQGVLKSILEPEIEKRVGRVIKLDNRTIYPIVQITAVRNQNQDFVTVEIFPIALVVEEPENKYVISLTDDEINSEELIELISHE